MANRIEFETVVSAAGFRKGLAEIEAAASAANMRLQNSLRDRMAAADKVIGSDTASLPEKYTAAMQRKQASEALQRLQTSEFARQAKTRIAISEKEAADRLAAAAATNKAVGTTESAITAKLAEEVEKRKLIAKEEAMERVLADQAATAAILRAEKAGTWARMAAEGAAGAAMLKNFAEQAAAMKAQQLELLQLVAMGQGAGVATGGGHGGGGISGIMRETLVIIREISMGRGFARVAGSVTLLAQYLGLLGTLVKSTAASAVLASAAESKLAQSMAVAALAAEAKATASLAATTAEGADIAATEALALADMESAAAARAAAVAQEAKAAAMAQSARIALASATVAIGPIGWITAAVVALVAVIGGLIWHYHTLAKEQKNLKDLLDPTTKKFREQTDAVLDATKQHREYVDWQKKMSEENVSLAENLDETNKKIRDQADAERELARARGASQTELNEMEIKELKAERDATAAAVAKAKAESAEAKKKTDDAEKAYNQGVGDAATDRSTKRAAENAGAVLDAAQKYRDEHPTTLTPDPDSPANAVGGPAYKSRPTTDNDPITVEVDGKKVTTTVNQAKADYDRLSKSAQDLEDAQQKLKDTFENAKSTQKERDEALKNLQKKEKEYQDQLAVKEGIGRQAAAAEDARSKGVGVDSMVRSGNFLGTARSGINNISQKQLDSALRSEHHLRSIDGKMGTAHDHGAAAKFSGS